MDTGNLYKRLWVAVCVRGNEWEEMEGGVMSLLKTKRYTVYRKSRTCTCNVS